MMAAMEAGTYNEAPSQSSSQQIATKLSMASLDTKIDLKQLEANITSESKVAARIESPPGSDSEDSDDVNQTVVPKATDAPSKNTVAATISATTTDFSQVPKKIESPPGSDSDSD